MKETEIEKNIPESTDQPISNRQLADQIKISNVGPRVALAAGRGAKAFVFNLVSNFLPVVVILLVIIGALLYLMLPKCPRNMKERTFNIAVAEFTVINAAEEPVESDLGWQLANSLYQRIRKTLPPSNYDVWGPDCTGQLTGSDAQELDLKAESLAQTNEADIVVYGIITESNNTSEFRPWFNVTSRGFELGDEVVGQHQLGAPLRLDLSTERVIDEILSGRMSAISLIAAGLEDHSNGDYAAARGSFSEAKSLLEKEKDLREEVKGTEVIDLLIANTFLMQASDKTMPSEDLKNAFESYGRALAINDQYGRAMIGQAMVLYRQGVGSLDRPNDINPDKLKEAAELYEETLGLDDQPSSASIVAKANFGLGQVNLVLEFASTERAQSDFTEAQDRFKKVIREHELGNNRIKDFAVGAYSYLGLIAVLENDFHTAIENYEYAVDLATDESKSSYYYELGRAYDRADQVDLALDAFNNCLDFAKAFDKDESIFNKCQEKVRKLNLDLQPDTSVQ